MLKLKLQYFGHLMQRTDSLEKSLMLGKIKGKRRRGQQRMRGLDSTTDSRTWTWANSRRYWRTEESGVLQSMQSQRVGYNWAYTHHLFSSVQFSHSLVFDSLRPHGLQHARLPCPSPTPGACPNSGPLSQWCHPTILSSVILFSSCLQSLQHQGLFQWVSSLHQVAKVLQRQLQHQSFQWIFRIDFF